MTSMWVIEPYRYKEKLLTEFTYLVQVDMGGVPATLFNIVSRRQPLAVAYLRDYLETTSLNSNRNGRSRE
uniref:START domain-containing protein n=1 Tax=Amphimedon queenslandica TaxID=400682 RepID=A0A1X7SXF3_AMPQE